MLGRLGGRSALEPLREAFRERARARLEGFFGSDRFRSLLRDQLGTPASQAAARVALEEIIDRGLAGLTPAMVQEMGRELVRRHLGRLVVWGGVLGGLIGLVAAQLA